MCRSLACTTASGRSGRSKKHRASERNHTALPRRHGQGHSGRAVAYPRSEDRHGGGADQRDRPDSPNPTRSAHSTAHDRHYVVILGGGQYARAVLLKVPVSVKVPWSSSRARWYRPARAGRLHISRHVAHWNRSQASIAWACDRRNCAQLGPADRPRTRLPADHDELAASAFRAPTGQPRSRSKIR
jgi:hypothetical protein